MAWHPQARRWAESSRGKLFAAALTPLDASRAVAIDACTPYFAALLRAGADGLAVAVHTGRGPFLPERERAALVGIARRHGAPVITGVGGGGQSIQADARWAATAAAAGAGALLVFPPSGPTPRILEYHDALWEASGLPLIAFDLYTGPYPDEAFAALVDHPAVGAVKLARLHDAVACQDRIAVVRERGKLAITGEDRMLGPSLLWGAEAALVGIGAAAVGLTHDVLRDFQRQDFAGFRRACQRLDRFAATTFRQPYDGYVQRMMWVAAAEGLIADDVATDPYGPPLPAGEQERVLEVWSSLSHGVDRATRRTLDSVR